jgi:hypothetical protein
MTFHFHPDPSQSLQVGGQKKFSPGPSVPGPAMFTVCGKPDTRQGPWRAQPQTASGSLARRSASRLPIRVPENAKGHVTVTDGHGHESPGARLRVGNLDYTLIQVQHVPFCIFLQPYGSRSRSRLK